MARIKTSAPFFDKGIDSITFKGTEAAASLPDLYDLAPAELARQPLTDQLLSAYTFNDFLEDTLRPDVNDPELLKPQNFQQTIGELRGYLDTQARARETSDPDTAKILRRVARLLNDEIDLRELLRANRAALYQG